MRILANEFVLPVSIGIECHASHLALLPDGRVFCVFFYGSKESHPDERIYGSFREQNGRWTAPFAISEDDGIAHWNPVLFKRNDGAYILYYKIGKTIPEWKTYYRISTDNCQTWSDSFELVPGDTMGGRGPVRNKAIYLSDGSILAPTSTEQGRWRCFFDRSTDNGKTWTASELLSISEEEGKPLEMSNGGNGIIQPTVWESEDGAHALMRSTAGKIYKTDSKDFVNWCQPYPIDIPNNNSGIDAVKLPDGRVFLACNPIGIKNVRTPLSLYVSNDDGNTFTFYSHLITMPGKYHYPAMIYEDGCLHLTYSWNFNTIAYMCLGDL